MAWCDDPKHKKYNEEITTNNKNFRENLHRKDHKYDYIISISHNEKKTPGKGSAVFIHLTDDYKPTAGMYCVEKERF